MRVRGSPCSHLYHLYPLPACEYAALDAPRLRATERGPATGSPAVLQHVGAARARCAVITLDTPGANYRSVWAMNKHFPNAKIFVRAHDVEHGLNLEKAGATAGAALPSSAPGLSVLLCSHVSFSHPASRPR
jgi:hypothetical protein